MYCKNCGQQIDDKAEICPKCGVRVAMSPIRLNPDVSAALSFFVPGLGQIYCGRIFNGVLIFIITTLTFWLGIGIIIWLWNIADAFYLAKGINYKGLIKNKLSQEQIIKIQENKKKKYEQDKKIAKIYTIVIIFLLVVFAILLWR